MAAYLYTDSKENYAETRNWIGDLLIQFAQAVSIGMSTTSWQPLPSESSEVKRGVTLSIDDRQIDMEVIDRPYKYVPSGKMVAVKITETGPREFYGLSIPFTARQPYVDTVTMWIYPQLNYDENTAKSLFAHHLMAAAKGLVEKNVASNLRITQDAMDQAVEVMNAEEPLRVLVGSTGTFRPTA